MCVLGACDGSMMVAMTFLSTVLVPGASAQFSPSHIDGRRGGARSRVCCGERNSSVARGLALYQQRFTSRAREAPRTQQQQQQRKHAERNAATRGGALRLQRVQSSLDSLLLLRDHF